MSISEKAMLVRLSISVWSARKHDKNVSIEVAAKHGTDASVGRYNKVIIARPEIKKIENHAMGIRCWNTIKTLPWSDEGFRILSAAMYYEYLEQFIEKKEMFWKLVDDFCKIYPELIEKAKVDLKGMFNLHDYPLPETVKNKFWLDTYFCPLPESKDFRVQLSKNETNRIRHDIETRRDDAIKEAMKDPWNRLYTVVKHMVDKLSDEDSRLRDSIVENIIKMIDILPKLNIVDDPNLDKDRKSVV